MRNHGATLTQIAQRQTTVPELQLSRAGLRADPASASEHLFDAIAKLERAPHQAPNAVQ
jgi:hypothetical protein